MRILACGGREYKNKKKVFSMLDDVHQSKEISVLIAGAARGADTLAEEWADSRKVEKLIFPADWKKYKKLAGFIRNQQMLTEGKPDAIVAFEGGAGTAAMIRRARAAGLPVIVVDGDKCEKPLFW